MTSTSNNRAKLTSELREINAAISQQHAIVHGLMDKDFESANVLVSRRAIGNARGRRMRHNIFVSGRTSFPTGETTGSSQHSSQRSDAETTLVESTSLFKAPWLPGRSINKRRLGDSAISDDEAESTAEEYSAHYSTATKKQQKELQVLENVKGAHEETDERDVKVLRSVSGQGYVTTTPKEGDLQMLQSISGQSCMTTMLKEEDVKVLRSVSEQSCVTTTPKGEAVKVLQSTSDQSCVTTTPKQDDDGSDSDGSFESVDGGASPVFTSSAPTSMSIEETPAEDKMTLDEVLSKGEMTTVGEQYEETTQTQSSGATSGTLTNRDLQALLHDKYEKSKACEAGVSDEIYQDCQELLRRLHMPYVVAPAEAEAQCVQLERQKLVDGIVSDDSDSWLFGASTVYRHFFNQQHHVQKYSTQGVNSGAASRLLRRREQMIAVAMLAGCDYTSGVRGIGPVAALEILAEFAPERSSFTDDSDVYFEALERFALWYRQEVVGVATVESLNQQPNNVRTRLAKQLIKSPRALPESFPDRDVYEAFLNPHVDAETVSSIRWEHRIGTEGLEDFLLKKLGWPTNRTQQLLAPVLKAQEARLKSGLQTRLERFTVKLQPSASDQRLVHSKRAAKALQRLQSEDNRHEEERADVGAEKPAAQETKTQRRPSTRAQRKFQSGTLKTMAQALERRQRDITTTRRRRRRADVTATASTSRRSASVETY